ncbi:unnamed protein product [Bemisia tabaci]|uniref:Uncharacterized protein n=1 Tax=Bemisia tabaci TaxID=7038 RepID=A0A9P0CCD5_BEMTA|nr:unnamed protein product [Bemisia tabaci]
MLFLNGAFVLILANLETRNFGVAAVPRPAFMLSEDACAQRCLSSHGYFGLAETRQPLPVSLGRVRFKTCLCNVTREFKKFVAQAVGPWTARMYPYFQKIGLGRWARNRMLRKNSKINFYTWDQVHGGEEEEQEEEQEEEHEEESGETHAETERKQHNTRSHNGPPRAPPTSPAAGAGAYRQQNVDVKALQSTGTAPLSLEAHLAQERISFDQRRAAKGLPPPPRSTSSRGSATSLSLADGSQISVGSGLRASKSQHAKSQYAKSQYAGSQYAGSQYAGSQYSKSRSRKE